MILGPNKERGTAFFSAGCDRGSDLSEIVD
jgi:hypothetical protein